MQRTQDKTIAKRNLEKLTRHAMTKEDARLHYTRHKTINKTRDKTRTTQHKIHDKTRVAKKHDNMTP